MIHHAPERLVVFGAGGHGREIVEAVLAINAVRPRWQLLGVLDDTEPSAGELRGLGTEFLGPTSRIRSLDARYVIGIGDGAVRRRLDLMAAHSARPATPIVHPTASVGRRVTLGPGCYVAAHATVTTNCVLGRHSHVNVGASVSHDNVMGAYCTLAPGTRLAGRVVTDDGVTLGLNSAVLPGVRLGAWSVVGAGATALRDVPARSVVIGTPAHPIEEATRTTPGVRGQ
ncbi:acetyltransferase [Streptomyces sp. NPDC055078]